MNCQEHIGWGSEAPTESGGVVSVPALCGKTVLTYRTCGAGAAVKCKTTIAYCDDHGGDARSQEEMREHHKEHGA